MADSHEYTVCDLAAGPKECEHPPDYTSYGYDSREWDGTKILLSKVTYICDPPKVRGLPSPDIFIYFSLADGCQLQWVS